MFSHLRRRLLIGVTFLLLIPSPQVQATTTRLDQDQDQPNIERARRYVSERDPRAEQEFRDAIAVRRGVHPEAWEELSSYLAEKQQFAEAAVAFRKYLKQTADKKYRPTFDRLRRLERAAELKARSEQKVTLSVTEMIELVRLVSGAASDKDAVPYAEKALEHYPESPEVLRVLAELIRVDQRERALELLNRAVSFAPNDEALYMARAWCYFWNHGDPYKAEQDFRRVIELSTGSNAGAWAGLGEALGRQGRSVEAISAYEKYMSIRPQSLAHYDGEIRKSIEMLRNKAPQP